MFEPKFADPAGVFASNTHRRVLAFLPIPDQEPMPLELVCERVANDAGPSGDLSAERDQREAEVSEILEDHRASGDAESQEGGTYRMTEQGLAKLRGEDTPKS